MDVAAWVKREHAFAHIVLDRELEKVTNDAQYRARPGGANSIAWVLWHATRCEDVAVNAMVRGVAQVLVSGDWVLSGALGETRMGTGLGDDEVSAFSHRVDLADIHAYRAAVRAETARWLDTAGPAVFDEHPDVDARLDAADGVLAESAGWVRELWRGWPSSAFIGWTAIGHTNVHTGEIQATLQRLGVVGR